MSTALRTALVLLAAVAPLPAGDACAGVIVAVTSDYGTGNAAWYDTDSGAFVPNGQGFADQDLAVVTDGADLYVLERSNGAVARYIGGVPSPAALAYQYSVGPGTNPQHMVFTGGKAYVLRLGADTVLVVNPHAAAQGGFVTGQIDLGGFDTNGAPEALYGVAYGGRVYIVLQRLDNWAAVVPGMLVAIDPATDTVIDLDPATPGVQGRDLLVKNPQFCDLAGGILYISGHVWAAQTEGVQTVDLRDPAFPQAMLLSEAVLGTDITGMEVLDTRTAFYTSTSWHQDGEGNWYQEGTATWFDPATGALGAQLPVPAPDGGAVLAGGIVYVGSRDDAAPGIYPVDHDTNTLAGNPLLTTLPPLAMVYIGEEGPTAVAADVAPPAFTLSPPFPNPFNPATAVRITLDRQSRVTAAVYAVNGQRVAVLAEGVFPAGTHEFRWDARGCASGVYVIRAEAGGTVCAVRAALVR